MKFAGFCMALALTAGIPQLASADEGQPGAAATANAAARGLRTRILTLGTAGGPSIRKLRSQPANLLVVDGRVYLIDTGEGVLRQLALAGFQPSQVDNIFLTHLHFDHTAGLASLMAFSWVGRRERPVEIYGPPGTDALTSAGLGYFSISEAIYAEELPKVRPMRELFHAHDVEVSQQPTVIYRDDKVRVLAVENSHYSTMHMGRQAYGMPKSYSYRFETPDRVVVFTGDTGPSEALARLAKGADVLVSEAIDVDATIARTRQIWAGSEGSQKPLEDHMRKEHFAPEDIGKLAAGAGVRMVVLTHLVPGGDDSPDMSPFTAGVRRYYNGPVLAARDLDEF